METVPEIVPVDCRLWGKEKGLSRPYAVVCHLLDAAAIFAVLWDVVLGRRVRSRIAGALGLSVDEARKVLSFWAGLHDLGKITPPFQAQVPEIFRDVRAETVYRFAPGADGDRAFRHEQATHWALTELLAEAGYPDSRLLRKSLAHQVGQFLGGHHGLFGIALPQHQVRRASAYQPGLGEEGWAVQRRAHFAELFRITEQGPVPRGALPAELAVVVAGLVIVADWLASQSGVIESLMPAPGFRATPAELDDHWVRVRRAAPGVVAGARLGRAGFAVERFEEMFPFCANALQADVVARLPGLVAEHGSGLVLVTAPPGDGKTETALFAASVLGRAADARGMYFALPTMATADAMYPRVREFVGQALDGARALTLLHSMAWLSPAYTGEQLDAVLAQGSWQADWVSSDVGSATEAGDWLRGRRRGLLAPLGVGTIDQVLSGVLPLRYNVLRLLGLSDKVFIVDEAHAYGPWMHQLLVRLLQWLGAFGAPVVLLSATLTGRTAASLVNAYRRGAGHSAGAAVEPRYPGWLFAAAGSGEVSAARQVGSSRSRRLQVRVRRVAWDSSDDPAAQVQTGGRREALREELLRVVEQGGTALVCCTTVVEAQRTWRDLRAAFPELAGREGGLLLLHSRYPAVIRQKITQVCESAYGKPEPGEAPRPRPASILVATQVVEQSVDLDFDLVVSDLAPLAQLLQRAGRGRRHRRGSGGRPGWAAREDRPLLVVLDPLDARGNGQPPRAWGSVYDPSLLQRTSLLLAGRTDDGIAVPGDIQGLVDAVYAEDFVDCLDDAALRELRRMDTLRQGEEMAETRLAEITSISAPGDITGDLYPLTRPEAGVSEELLTTRLGADSGRVLCLYEHHDGQLTLDPQGTHPLPSSGAHGPPRHALVQIMAHVAPVPGRWLRGGEGHPPPRGWDQQPVLRDLVLLRMQATDEDGSWACRHGDRVITISRAGLESP